MKTLLIVFAVLLLLLTLLSTFGGSIRPSEQFYQEPKQRNEYYYDGPPMSMPSEQFMDSEGPIVAPPMSEQYESSPAPYMSEQYTDMPGGPEMPGGISSGSGPSMPGMPSENYEDMPQNIPVNTERFAAPPKPPVPTSFGENYVNVPSMPEVPIMPGPKKASYTNAPANMQDGFMIEPFEEDKKVSFYASF
jgi:hypothetical protein